MYRPLLVCAAVCGLFLAATTLYGVQTPLAPAAGAGEHAQQWVYSPANTDTQVAAVVFSYGMGGGYGGYGGYGGNYYGYPGNYYYPRSYYNYPYGYSPYGNGYYRPSYNRNNIDPYYQRNGMRPYGGNYYR